MFIAVGDEGCQRVDVVGMLHHGHFIGLLKKKEAQRNYKQAVTSVHQVSCVQDRVSTKSSIKAPMHVAKTSMLMNHAVYCILFLLVAAQKK